MKVFICNAFWVALLLTGDSAKAEEVVQAAIEFLDADDLSGEALLIFVSTLALQLDDDESVPGGDESVLSVLPNELRNVIRLPRMKRQCFVLHILLGFPEDRCAGLLHVQDRAISDEAGAAMSELASMSVTHSWSNSPEEFHLQALTQRSVNLSIQTAPIVHLYPAGRYAAK